MPRWEEELNKELGLRCGSSILSYLPSLVFGVGLAILLKNTDSRSTRNSNFSLFQPPGKLLLVTTVVTEALRIWTKFIVLVDLFCNRYLKNLNRSLWLLNMSTKGAGEYLKPAIIYILDAGTLKVLILMVFSLVPFMVSLALKKEDSRLRIMWYNARQWAMSELGSGRYYLLRPCRGLEPSQAPPATRSNSRRASRSDTALLDTFKLASSQPNTLVSPRSV